MTREIPNMLQKIAIEGERENKRGMIILILQYWTSFNPHHVLMSLHGIVHCNYLQLIHSTDRQGQEQMLPYEDGSLRTEHVLLSCDVVVQREFVCLCVLFLAQQCFCCFACFVLIICI